VKFGERRETRASGKVSDRACASAENSSSNSTRRASSQAMVSAIRSGDSRRWRFVAIAPSRIAENQASVCSTLGRLRNTTFPPAGKAVRLKRGRQTRGRFEGLRAVEAHFGIGEERPVMSRSVAAAAKLSPNVVGVGRHRRWLARCVHQPCRSRST
jgi:hypothetical protein